MNIFVSISLFLFLFYFFSIQKGGAIYKCRFHTKVVPAVYHRDLSDLHHDTITCIAPPFIATGSKSPDGVDVSIIIFANNSNTNSNTNNSSSSSNSKVSVGGKYVITLFTDLSDLTFHCIRL